MDFFSDSEAEQLVGGFRIVVNPTIAISTAVITGLQGTNGTSIGLGVLGVGSSDLGQLSGMSLTTLLANLGV